MITKLRIMYSDEFEYGKKNFPHACVNQDTHSRCVTSWDISALGSHPILGPKIRPELTFSCFKLEKRCGERKNIYLYLYSQWTPGVQCLVTRGLLTFHLILTKPENYLYLPSLSSSTQNFIQLILSIVISSQKLCIPEIEGRWLKLGD